MKSIVKTFGLTLFGMAIVFSASAAMTDKAINDRLTPVGKVCIGGSECGSVVAAVAPSSGPKSGEDIFNASCKGCHGTGVLGAPKFGDAAAWSPRLAKGEDVLLNHAISGFNAMPPRGTCAACSDDEIAQTIRYMLDHSK